MRQPAGPREPADPQIADMGLLLAQVDGRPVTEVDAAVDARRAANLLLRQLADRRKRRGAAHVSTLPAHRGRFYRPLWDTWDASQVASAW